MPASWHWVQTIHSLAMAFLIHVLKASAGSGFPPVNNKNIKSYFAFIHAVTSSPSCSMSDSTAWWLLINTTVSGSDNCNGKWICNHCDQLYHSLLKTNGSPLCPCCGLLLWGILASLCVSPFTPMTIVPWPVTSLLALPLLMPSLLVKPLLLTLFLSRLLPCP